jgi:hypothetical protein
MFPDRLFESFVDGGVDPLALRATHMALITRSMILYEDDAG